MKEQYGPTTNTLSFLVRLCTFINRIHIHDGFRILEDSCYRSSLFTHRPNNTYGILNSTYS